MNSVRSSSPFIKSPWPPLGKGGIIVVFLGFILLLWLDIVSLPAYANPNARPRGLSANPNARPRGLSAADPIDEGQLQNVDDKTTATLSAFRYNSAKRTYFGSATVTNTSAGALPKTMYLVVNAITPDSVNVVNQHGSTVSGKPYYDVSPLIEGDTIPVGAITNPLILEFTNPQRVQFQVDLSVYVASAPNTPPVITSIPVSPGTEGVAYSYDVEAEDADEDILTYALSVFPDGMSIDDATGKISWTPGAAQAGSHDVTVKVSDGKGGTYTQSFAIKVAEALNVSPVITSTPITAGAEGVAYTYDVEATDGDGDTLTYSLMASPNRKAKPSVNEVNRMTIDSATGIITWASSSTQSGIYPVTVSVTDGRGGTDNQSFSVEITGGFNVSPVIIIIILSTILAAGTTIGIRSFLRKGTRQGDKKNATETSEVVEKLTEVMNQLEGTSENGEQKTENTAGEMSPKLKPLKESSKKAVNRVQETTTSADENAPQKPKLEVYPDDDEISALVETLAKLTDEYEETYQTLRQHIAYKYKQLQEASEYIDAQVEKLNKLTSNDSIETEDEIQEGKHPPKYAEVHELAEQGIDRLEIAQKTGLPVGEVDLLLSLSNQAESED